MAPHVRFLAWHFGFDMTNVTSASQVSGSQASGSQAGHHHSPLTITAVASEFQPTVPATASGTPILPVAPTAPKRRLVRKTSSDPTAAVLALYGLTPTQLTSSVLVEELDSPSPVDISDTDNSQAAASSRPPGGKTWWDESLGTLVMQLPDQSIIQAEVELGDKGFCRAVWPWGQAEMTEKPWLGLQPVI